ncbi:hypothetical protein G9A89_000293 [Geosiphon pyriformis]|nr:hypothetical protein G9A89_000293 [Geosiphon pyriformis]
MRPLATYSEFYLVPLVIVSAKQIWPVESCQPSSIQTIILSAVEGPPAGYRWRKSTWPATMGPSVRTGTYKDPFVASGTKYSSYSDPDTGKPDVP